MRYLSIIVFLLIFSLSSFAYNWGNRANEGSIIIENSVISGSVVSGNLSNTGVIGSGKREIQQRTIDDFDKVAIHIVADVIITSGKQYHMSIEADDNILKIISTNVYKKRLIISSPKSYSTRQPIKINIEVPFLKEVKQSGAGSVFLDNVSTLALNIVMSGSGTISANGAVENLTAEIKGSGDMNLQQLIAKRVKINISGAADASLQVLEQLDVRVQGVGNIIYSGNPKIINKSISGIGRVIHQ